MSMRCCACNSHRRQEVPKKHAIVFRHRSQQQQLWCRRQPRQKKVTQVQISDGTQHTCWLWSGGEVWGMDGKRSYFTPEQRIRKDLYENIGVDLRKKHTTHIRMRIAISSSSSSSSVKRGWQTNCNCKWLWCGIVSQPTRTLMPLMFVRI